MVMQRLIRFFIHVRQPFPWHSAHISCISRLKNFWVFVLIIHSVMENPVLNIEQIGDPILNKKYQNLV